MTGQPPRSHPFPYTTLSRSQRDEPLARTTIAHCRHQTPTSSSTRSEEHTSELQSRSDLVCRLLLEKNIREIIFCFLGPPVCESRGSADWTDSATLATNAFLLVVFFKHGGDRDHPTLPPPPRCR